MAHAETPEDRSAVQLGAQSAADILGRMPVELREDARQLLADDDRVNRLLESTAAKRQAVRDRHITTDNLDEVLREIHRAVVEAQKLTEQQQMREMRVQPRLSETTARNYLRDLGRLVLETAIEARAAASGSEPRTDDIQFARGRLRGYYEVVSLMQNQAAAFGVDLDFISMRDVDPDEEFL